MLPDRRSDELRSPLADHVGHATSNRPDGSRQPAGKCMDPTSVTAAEKVGVESPEEGPEQGLGPGLLRGSSEAESRLMRSGLLFLLAAVAYIPQLLAQPGVVSSDTKTYLYLDITRYLPQSASMWDPTV